MVLGFDITDRYLSPVTYTDERPVLDFNHPSLATATQLLNAKFSGWSYEEEVHLFT